MVSNHIIPDLTDLKKTEDNLYRLIDQAVEVISECRMCGECCKNLEFIRITPFEADRISRYLKRPIRDFTTIVRNPPSIALKKDENNTCIFLKDNRCMIHPVRPFQCRAIPAMFSSTALESPTYKGCRNGYYYFECPSTNCVVRIRVEDFIRIAGTRLFFLENIISLYSVILRS